MSVSNVPVSKMARRAGLQVSGRLLGARLHALCACAVSMHSERSIRHDSRLHFSWRERETKTLISGYGVEGSKETGYCAWLGSIVDHAKDWG